MRKQRHQSELEKEQLRIEDLELGIQEHKDIEEAADRVADWTRDLEQVKARVSTRLRLYGEHVKDWKRSENFSVKWLDLSKQELAVVEKTIKEHQEAN